MPYKKKAPAPENSETWLKESQEFSQRVIEDTLEELRQNDNDVLSRAEAEALMHLEVRWLNKFMPEERQPESNPRPLTPPPPPKKRTRKTKPITKPVPEKIWNVNEIPDNEIIINRICIPRLRKQWTIRKFDITMPAFLIKRNMLNPMFNWPLLDRIMELPESEGTNILQNCVDERLQEIEHEQESEDCEIQESEYQQEPLNLQVAVRQMPNIC